MIVICSQFSETFLDFIIHNHDKRIKTETLDFYRKIDNPAIIAIHYSEDGKDILCISSSAVIDNECKYNITVTKIGERNKGLGTKTLDAKINHIHLVNVKYSTQIAEDNKPSLRILEKINLNLDKKISTDTRKNGKEEYTLLLIKEI